MTISSESDLAGMRRVGRLVARTIAHMREQVRPGVTTGALDAAAERLARGEGARSAPQLTYDFPGFTCISVNEQVVHGVPGPRVLAPGDVVKLEPVSTSSVRINAGFFVLRREIFDYMLPGEEFVFEPFERLIKEQRLLAYPYDGFWRAMDTFKDKVELDKIAAAGSPPWEVWGDAALS